MVVDFLTMGEAMLRLSPPGHDRLLQAEALECKVAGAEANVAVALSCLGLNGAFATRVPAGPLGDKVVRELRGFGVDTSLVRRPEGPSERLGLYFLETGSKPRANRVIYDRAGSSASRMVPADFDAASLDALAPRWVHLTGITPALSQSCLEATAAVIAWARAKGNVTISFDVNYRALLWTPAKAAEALEPLLKQCDVVICAHRDAVALFGVPEVPEDAARALRERLACPTLLMTASERGAIVATKEGAETVPGFVVPEIVDRIGAGDAFDAGFIAGRLRGMSLKQATVYGHATSASKMTIPGDMCITSAAEIDAVISGSSLATIR